MLWTDKYGPKLDVEALTTNLDTGRLGRELIKIWGWGWRDGGSAVKREVGNKTGGLLLTLPSRLKSQGGEKKQAITKGCRKPQRYLKCKARF